jgi:hypothetical protein
MRTSFFLLLALSSAMLGNLPEAFAQEADGHPARIHAGACDDLGTVAFDLTALGAEATAEGTPVPAPEFVGSASAVPMQISETSLEATLSDLVDEELAIVVYGDDETVVACGAIGGPLTMQMAGMVMPGDELAVGLAEADDSGYSGLALIRAEGKTASVRIFLAG